MGLYGAESACEGSMTMLLRRLRRWLNKNRIAKLREQLAELEMEAKFMEVYVRKPGIPAFYLLRYATIIEGRNACRSLLDDLEAV
jgi:hypothetical protein